MVRVETSKSFYIDVQNKSFGQPNNWIQYSTAPNANLLGKIYIEKWVMLAIYNEYSTMKFFINTINDFIVNYPFIYDEKVKFDHFIGYNSNSFHGFFWSYTIYDQHVDLSQAFSAAYSQSVCLNNFCPYLCQYDYFYISNDNQCHKCNQECQSCSNEINCITCLIINSEPDTDIGCKCKTGYYKVNNYSNPSLMCAECHSTCRTCNKNSICLDCKQPNTQISKAIGCECQPGFYNTSALEIGGLCMACQNDCKTCHNKHSCITCIDKNAQIYNEQGCICKEGFFNQTSLATDKSCKSVEMDVKSALINQIVKYAMILSLQTTEVAIAIKDIAKTFKETV